MTRPFTVVALIAAYNEEDIIEACLEHLTTQSIQSYLLDDGSTDRTVERARAFLGKGLLAIESLPVTAPPTFSLRRILRRKQALAQSLDASWFINQDADEFRDSLWSELNLRQAIERVDRLGWNAIDFQLFTMRLVGSPESARARPDDSESWYSPAAKCDRLQVRAWKQPSGEVDLCSSAGHDVQYEGRSVFPLRFPMRHYPVRTPAQGQQKIFLERLPRFDPRERAQGWHVQYDQYDLSVQLTAQPSDLEPYDSVTSRIQSALSNRDLEAARARATELNERVEHLSMQVRLLTSERDRLERDGLQLRAQFDAERRQVDSERRQMDSERRQVDSELASLERDLADLHASRSWRWTKPLRIVLRLFRGW